MESYRILVGGKVQHVYYRKFVSQAMMKAGVQGYVRNLEDGRVEVVVRIYADDLSRVEQIIYDGSPTSRVDAVEIAELDGDDIVYDGFEIRY